MSSLTVHLPDSLYRSLQSLAARQGCTMDEFLARAAAEKVEALQAIDHLRREGASGRREDFERFLAAVPDEPPIDTDQLSE